MFVEKKWKQRDFYTEIKYFREENKIDGGQYLKKLKGRLDFQKKYWEAYGCMIEITLLKRNNLKM